MDQNSSRRRLGVLEFSTHENFLADLCRIATEVVDLTVFTTDEIRRRVTDDLVNSAAIDWVVVSDGDATERMFSTIEIRSGADLDALWLFSLYGTVLDYLRYARFSPVCPLILSAYDLNGWLGHNPGVTRKVYNYLKYPLKRRLLSEVNVVTVEFKPIQEHVGSRLGEVSVHTFTPVLSEGCVGSRTESNLVVTVPGMIDETRRNYGTLLDALAHARRTEGLEAEVVFLGRPVDEYGHRTLERASGLTNDGLTITSFDDWIPTDTFRSELTRSDVLVSPLRRTRRSDGFVEEYGQSKGSGAISDAIRYATPLVLPEWLEIPETVAPGVTTYSDPTDLGETLTGLATDESALEHKRRGAGDMAAEYTIDKQRDRFETILEAAIES